MQAHSQGRLHQAGARLPAFFCSHSFFFARPFSLPYLRSLLSARRVIVNECQTFLLLVICLTPCLQWGSWGVIGKSKRVYFSGDTGYCPAFKEIGQMYGPFDLSLIAIGASAAPLPDITHSFFTRLLSFLFWQELTFRGGLCVRSTLTPRMQSWYTKISSRGSAWAYTGVRAWLRLFLTLFCV